MVKLSNARIDLDAERDGVWRECPILPGFWVKIASTDSQGFEAAMAKRRAPYVALEREDASAPSGSTPKVTDAMRQDMLREVFADAIVKDWKGADDDSGAPVACTREEVLRVLSDPQLRDIWKWIVGEAAARENYRAQKLAASVGN